MKGFYPNKPTKAHRIHRIMQLTGWKPKPFYWQDKTVCDYKDRGEGINRHCKDIRKSTVDKAFTKVFGYSSFVDPSGTGKAVIKSEKNWAHDGRIVELPYELKEGEVCQMYIDTFDGERYNDLRILIIDSEPVLTMQKQKPKMFDSAGADMHIIDMNIFNEGIEDLITEFCKEIGMDYGELDMLNGYIIDANKTPGGYKWVDKLGDEFINSHKPLFL